MRSYAVRPASQNSFCITVPTELAKAIPAGTQFVPELTEDGVLYRKVDRVVQQELPSWAQQTERPNRRARK